MEVVDVFKVEVLKGFRMVLEDWVWGDGGVLRDGVGVEVSREKGGGSC